MKPKDFLATLPDIAKAAFLTAAGFIGIYAFFGPHFSQDNEGLTLEVRNLGLSKSLQGLDVWCLEDVFFEQAYIVMPDSSIHSEIKLSGKGSDSKHLRLRTAKEEPELLPFRSTLVVRVKLKSAGKGQFLDCVLIEQGDKVGFSYQSYEAARTLAFVLLAIGLAILLFFWIRRKILLARYRDFQLLCSHCLGEGGFWVMVAAQKVFELRYKKQVMWFIGKLCVSKSKSTRSKYYDAICYTVWKEGKRARRSPDTIIADIASDILLAVRKAKSS